MHIYTGFYTEWYWNVCKFILKFTQGNIEVCSEQFWSLHSVILKFVECDNRVCKSDTKVYTVIMKFTEGDAEVYTDTEVYIGWY